MTQRVTPDLTPGGWDRASKKYDEVATGLTGSFAGPAIDLLQVGPDHTVLDVAAGSGATTKTLAPRAKRVVAVDFSSDMIQLLNQRVSDEGWANVETAVMDGQNLEFEDERFDRAISVFGVIFFPDRIKGMSELRRVLVPGGTAAVVAWGDPARNPLLSIWGEGLRQAVPDLPAPQGPPPIFSLADPELFRSELEAAGLQDVRVETIETVHRWANDPQEFWELWHDVSPALGGFLEDKPEHYGRVRDATIGLLEQRYGQPIEGEHLALVGLGTKQ